MTILTEQGLWLRLLKLGTTDDPLSSFEYGTIVGNHASYLWWFFVGKLLTFAWSLANICLSFAALIESDADGIGGSGFVECIREHIHTVCLVVEDYTLFSILTSGITRFSSGFCLAGVDLSID